MVEWLQLGLEIIFTKEKILNTAAVINNEEKKHGKTRVVGLELESGEKTNIKSPQNLI